MRDAHHMRLLCGQMIHRREISPGDPRGNDSVVMDDVFVASFSDATSDSSAYLLGRQVSAHMTPRVAT